jgi:hypothetical protein
MNLALFIIIFKIIFKTISNMGKFTPKNEKTQSRTPIKHGRFVFSGIQEGAGPGSRRVIQFRKPVVINYEIFQKKDAKTGEDCFPEDVPMVAFVKYDFGLVMQTTLDEKNNALVKGYNGKGYEGLSKDSELEDILMYTIIFDIFHAFCHATLSPNYTYYHWALKGWLRENAILIEDLTLDIPPKVG